MCVYKIKQKRNIETKTYQELKLTLDSTTRESELKPSNSLAKQKSYELNFPHMLITISLCGFVFPGVLYQLFDLADRVVVNDT